MLEGPRRLISGLARKIAPAPATWRGATWGALLATFVLWLVEAGPRIAGASDNLGAWLGILTATVAITLAGLFASLLVRWLGALPPRYRWIVATAVLLALAMNEIASVTLGGMTIVTASAIVLGSVAGGSLAVWLRNRRQWVALASLVVASMALAIGIRWMFVEGNAPYVATQLPAGVAPLDRPDPSQPGSYAVKTLTYGSGADRWRPEFGAAVGEMFRTESIDGSKLVEQWSGAAGWARTRYWGFDAKHMPLQARVWYPEGAGPFPLVIIVHGNHNMEDYSDPGYAYLGELMASRGFIVASLDENFINSSVGSDLLGFPNISIKKETDARAWLLLEHLRVWRAWNAREGHPFFRRVDMSQIAIMGHSRGGEAVAVAAAFNRLPYYPDDAHIRFDYDFDIRTVIAIAPVDGQYKPTGRPTEPHNVNYLVLHGTEDGDLSSFHGSRQFERIQFTDNQYWCKATLYIRGANHGQFNTVWGRHDQSGFGARFLNFSGIMPPDAQRQIAKVSISAFLEATLHGQTDYLTLFRTPQAGQKWLPPTVYRNKFQDSTYRFLATYEEDLDLTTTTLPGGSMLGENLSDWRERALEITWGDLDTHAVVLGWNPKESKATPSYALTLPRLEAVTHDDVLVFTLADTNEDETTPKSAAPIEFTLEMVGRGGAVTRTPIALGRQIETNVFKAAFARRVPPSELVFQSFEVPVAVDDLTMVRFVFDKSASGVVALDDVGFRARVPARAHALLP